MQGTAKWANASKGERAVINASLAGLCATLDGIKPNKPIQNKALVLLYKAGIQVLRATGWLSQTQATKLTTYADKLL